MAHSLRTLSGSNSMLHKRTCSICKQSLPIKCFNLNEKYGRCNGCRKGRAKSPSRYKAATSDTQIGKAIRSAKYQSKNKGYAGLEVTEFEATIAHKGTCDICGIKETDLVRKLHIDHCHTSGKFRGWLCIKCNTGLGHFNDNIELLKKAIKYLRDSRK